MNDDVDRLLSLARLELEIAKVYNACTSESLRARQLKALDYAEAYLDQVREITSKRAA